MRYRVDELAARAGVTVDTVRYYQTKGLLPPPERRGRVAYYSGEHVERLEGIKRWKERGLTLAAIARLVSGTLDRADEALLGALAETLPGDDRFMTLDELAQRTGVSAALLEAIEREGLLVPHVADGAALYSEADAAAVGAGLELLEAGLPLSELLALAREHDGAMQAIAERAVDLFVRFVRDPIRARSDAGDDGADELVRAFRRMLPAVTALVGHHFRRVLVAAALRRIESEGDEREIEAVRDSGPLQP